MTTLDEAIALYSSGRPREAFERVARELPALLNVAAAAAYAQGLLDEAEKHWRLALAVKPDYADAHNNLGLLFSDLGHMEQAEAAYRQALAADPRHVDTYNNLGVLLDGQGRWAEAEAAYNQALALQPDDPNVHNNLGSLLQNTGRLPAAEAAFRRALSLRPNYPEAHYNLGSLLALLNRHAEAEAAYRQALALRPGHTEALSNLGILLAKLKRHDEAEAAHRQALALRPGFAEAYINLGVMLSVTSRHAEAEAAYRQALALKPDSVEALANLAAVLAVTNRPEEAEAYYRQALALKPGCVKTRFNFSLLLLSLGRLSEAWPLHEARYHAEQTDRLVAFPKLPFPQWQGEPLAGKAVLVWQEQGYGDEIQFCRLVPLLKAHGATRVGLACKPPLAPLLKTLDGLDAVHPEQPGQAFEGYDCWTFLLSIPLHCGLELDNLPAKLPYLRPLPDRIGEWQTRLPKDRPRVGLVWKGYAEHGNDANRSLPGLATLAPLWTVPGVAFVSLQKGAGEEESRQPPDGLALTHLGSALRDFADTAAIAAQLDLVICVDTAAAHLCGALAKPCWVLLPHIQPDWRWLRGREDSPWYPGVLRLFRQGQAESWADVAGRVALALRQWREDWAG
jgi:Flp pilus assembly protein TadD